MMQCPPCPQTTDELGLLIHALTSENFDKTPDEIRRESEELKEKLRQKGTSEIAILAYTRILDVTEKYDEEARAYMLRWGRNRGEAIRSYTTHFKQPCNWCVDIYTDIVAYHAITLMEDDGVDFRNVPERVKDYLLKANLVYLGNPALNIGGQISLDDILRHPN